MALPLLRQSRGDTLVEVTLALTILAAVLISCFSLASVAFRLGQSAKERTQASNFVQEQAEALRNYRDNNPWGSFTSGVAIGNFYMARVPAGTGSWQPQVGSFTPLIDGNPSIFTLSITPFVVGPNQERFQVNIRWRNNGSGPQNTTALDLFLVNKDNITPIDCSAGGPQC